MATDRISRKPLSRRDFLAASAAYLALRKGNPSPERGPGLEEKIGQMILVGFRGLALDASNPIATDIRDRRIGGVVLFDYDVPSKSPVRNIESSGQVKSLVASLQKIAMTPLFVAVDQEGGKVSRLKERFGFPPTVSQRSLGVFNDPAVTRRSAEAAARVLAEAGFNLNFAPVVDLDTNPENPVIGGLERSFAADPKIVTAQALEVVRAHHESGILTTLKHFPGHGSSRGDSHLGFTDVTETWSRRELEPYAKIIEAGQCDSIMTAHVFNARLDPKLPATLSRRTIDGLLREGMAYDGVVISDDMQMKAIASEFGLKDAIIKAVGAGVDILTFANNSTFEPGIAREAIGILTGAVADGRIPIESINRSYERILKLKTRFRV
jgi:beta-N-acetylhexosaminidase